MADPRGIQHPQRAIALRSPLLWIERATCWTAERPIRLESEICASKSFGVRWMCPLRRSIDDRSWFRWSETGAVASGDSPRRCRSKFRRAHGRGVQCMPQFETKIPDPLRKNMPELLAPGGVRAPAIYVLLLVFITSAPRMPLDAGKGPPHQQA